jgi:hypothetical protein
LRIIGAEDFTSFDATFVPAFPDPTVFTVKSLEVIFTLVKVIALPVITFADLLLVIILIVRTTPHTTLMFIIDILVDRHIFSLFSPDLKVSSD